VARRADGEEQVDGRLRRDTRFGPSALFRHHPRTRIHAGPEVIAPRSTQVGGMWLCLALRARFREKPRKLSSGVVSSGPCCAFGS
jgi:hypothetical protein